MIRHFCLSFILRYSVALAVGGLFFAGAQDDEGVSWHTDYKVALQKAKDEDKQLFILFTGTDWIEICQIFDREIATSPDFVDLVGAEFVLLKLEYPKDNRLPREQATQNQLLRDAYRVRGFPTVVLSRTDGRPFGLNGYQPIEPAQYAKQILEMNEVARTKFQKLEEAKSLEGMAKAKKLLEGIPELPGNLSARYFRKEMEEVIQLDTKKELEQSPILRKLIADVEYSAEMQKLAKDVQWGKMIQLTDQYITEFKLEGPALQKALLNKAGVQQQQANHAGRIETLLAIVKIDPKSPYAQEAQDQLNQLRAKKLEGSLVE